MTTDSAGIVERLRESAAYDSYGPDRVRLDIREAAAAHIEAQAVELEKMREALEKIANNDYLELIASRDIARAALGAKP